MSQNKSIKTLQQKEVKFVLTTLVLTVANPLISAYFKLGWATAAIFAFGMYFLLMWFAYKQNDLFLKKLLVFGLAAGIVELIADCWLVNKTYTLVYAGDEPMIACSPIYMPFAWAVILIQIGYLSWLISNKEKLWKSMIAATLIGFAVIPLFEHCAKNAEWWYYRDTPMLYNTPWFIILAEGMICSMLPLFFKHIHQKNYTWQLGLGIIEGLWIWASYFIAFYLVG